VIEAKTNPRRKSNMMTSARKIPQSSTKRAKRREANAAMRRTGMIAVFQMKA
jgi:hypothetical protein